VEEKRAHVLSGIPREGCKDPKSCSVGTMQHQPWKGAKKRSRSSGRRRTRRKMRQVEEKEAILFLYIIKAMCIKFGRSSDCKL
jgi:hypothetical protein